MPLHYPDNGLVSGTRGKVSRNQEEDECLCSSSSETFSDRSYPSHTKRFHPGISVNHST
ncbi:hypothetical protein AVEN_184879-1, partial [Araneus ventricosus]